MNTHLFIRSADRKWPVPTAFTLLELLVVISIIAILAGLLLPVTGAVMQSAKKTSAKSTEMQIVAAVKSFQTDYGVYPVIPGVTQNGSDTTVGGSATNANLFNILRANGQGTDAAATSPNTRRIVYFEGKDVKTLSKPVDGFIPATGTPGKGNTGAPALSNGDLVDPWGNLYYVCYDSGYTDQVANPYSAGPGSDDAGDTSGKAIRTGVIAWSYGKDGKMGNNGTVVGTAPAITSYGDDVISWQ